MELHADAGVGLVDAVGVHGIPVLDAAQRQLHVHAHLAERVGEDLLERAHDVVLLDEAHLDVDLGELGLAVGAQVLVAEALGDLVVLLDAAHHEQLLEELRALGQGVEVAGLQAGRHDEVARTLGRGLEERRRLDLHEAAVVEGLADREGEVGAQLEVGHHLGTADVEVAVLEAQVLAGLDVVLDLERGRLGGVEHLDLGAEHLDLAGCEVGVGLALDAMAHLALDEDRPLGTHGLGGGEHLGRAQVGVEEDLGEALAVAQVDEDQAAEISTGTDPSGKRDCLADVLCTQLTAGVRVHGMERHGSSFRLYRPVPDGRLPSRRHGRVDGTPVHSPSIVAPRMLAGGI